MSFKNKFKAKIKRLLAKEESSDLLGITLRQKSLAFCVLSPDKPIRCDETNIVDSHANTLKSISSAHDVKGQTHLVLSAQQAQIVQVDKPNIPEEELNNALKWQIKDLVSVTPDNMLLDYFNGPNLAGVEKLHVVCASLSDVKTLTEPLLKEPFTLRSIITEEFAFANLVENTADAKLLVCQQPNEEIVIIIVKEGKIFFYRRLRGFCRIASKSNAELEMGIIDNLSLEIQRSTDYFERQLKQAPIKSIEVLVPMENEGFLARKLSENTNVAVNLFSLPEGFEEYRENAVAIGAIYPAYREFNPSTTSNEPVLGEVLSVNDEIADDKDKKVIIDKDVPTHG